MDLTNINIEALSPEEQRALLAQLLEAESKAETHFPLSFNQQRLWFLDKLEGGSVYNLPVVLELDGTLDVACLTQALNEIVRRHAVLRTVYQAVDGLPQQVILADAPVALPIINLQHLPLDKQEEAIRRLSEEEAQLPFDLTQDVMLRGQLLQQAADKHVLLLTMHHIASDGWSIRILTRELRTLYAAFVERQPSPLPELPIQYVDFAHWQREWLQGDVLENLLSYWKAHLADAPKVLDLPHDRPRPAVQSYHGARYRFELDSDLTAKLNELAQKQNATLFMVLLSGFNILLSRYSRQTDIVVGTAVANRNRAEIEGLIGFFVNTLALRTRLDDNPSFVELLGRVRQNTLAAYQHQELPFEQLVDELQLERTLSYSPLFQAMLALQTTRARDEAATPVSSGASLTTVPRPFDVTFAKYDLTLLMTESNEGLSGAFKYNTDLFDQATIARLANHFANLLRHIVEQPLAPVLQLPLSTQAEYRQLAHEWNMTDVDFGEPQTLHALFEAQVMRTPNAVALTFVPAADANAHQLTYAELNARANQLAHHLIALGVQADSLVALAVDRSPEMIIGLLAVLKAGGAYVPIDPTYPVERIRYMLADCAAPIVLTQSRLEFPHAAAHVITLDQSEAIDVQPTHNPCTETLPDHLAYVIYTSGSTGQPKGVMISHSSVFNVLQWTQNVFELTPADRMLARTSLSFDVAARELLSPLTCGASIVLVTTEQQRDLRQLLTVINAHNVSIAHFTPTLLTALLNIIEEGSPPDGDAKPLNLRILMSGGEPLTPSLTSRIRKNLAGTLLNSYGPSETTISVGLQVVSADFAPIAPPAPNNRFYILDESGQLVPLGVAGELHIGGNQLARGYLNRPELTAVRFIEHSEFGRLYKTGDLCRWLPDGTLAFIGRTDFQVKVRSFRIELGEIENALLAHRDIQEAVVLARDEQEDKRLVAYFVGEAESDSLRQHLSERLPDYMMPTAFVPLSAMPLTPNGKLNRNALPAPDYADTETTYVSPRNKLEIVLAQTFADVLRLPHVGVHDNFFRMGGDSILTIQLVSRVAKRGYTISVKDVFLHPTVAELVTVVRTTKPQIVASQTAQLGNAPLLPIQRAFLASNQAQMHHYNQSFLLMVKRPFAPAQLEAAIRALLSHHDALRFQYTRNEVGWQQQYLAPSERVPLAFVDLSAHPSDHVAQIEAIGAQTQASLDPLSGDLVRFVYFKSADSDDRLLIVIHHLAVDGVSWRILLEDLATLLDGGQLPPKTSSTRDWAEALRAATENGRFDAEINRWLSEPLDTPLPLDAPAALNSMENRHQLKLILSERETEHLLRTLPDLHDVTLDAVLLTALTETLTDYSGHDALRVKFESHGRPELFDTVNLNRTVGWFTTTYPLTIPRFTGSALKRIRYTLEQLRSVPDGGISFGALHDFHPDKAIRQQFAALPMAQVVYNYLGQLDNLNNEHFSRSQESAGAAVSPHFQRNSLLDSNARVVNKQLHINWHVTPQISRENAESLLAAFKQRVDALISEALNSTEQVAIPTDFPTVSLSLSELETLQRTVDFTNVETVLALAPMQVGMLFHSQFAPNSGTYIEHKLFHVRDTTFEPRRLVAALQRVIDRHDALRATFQTEGRAVQIIHRQTTLPVTFVDWRALSDTEQQARLAQYIEQDRLTDFDLSQPPLLRFAVIQQAENEYDLLLTFHHLLMDRWSVDLVWSEVLASYAERPLPKAIPYQTYIHDLRQRVDSAEFWQTYLHGFDAPTPLPAATHPAQNHGRSATLVHELSVESTQQLTTFAREQGLTVNTLFQAAWAVLLAQYARESDVLFGMVTSGRTALLRGIDSIVGLMINTLPLRVQLNSEMTVSALLQQLTRTQLEIQQREDALLVDVQRWSDVPAGTRLFESLFLFQNTPKSTKSTLDNLNLRIERVEPGDTGYPLVALAGVKESATLMLSYNTALYEAETVERLLTHWRHLLMGLVSNPEQAVGQLSMLPEAEYHKIVREWNDTAVDYGEPQTIHALFEQQVQRTPNAVAVVFEDEQLTYAELNARANQLAHHLIELGVQPNTLIAIAMERSIEMVVSLLAILKAGRAYVPIDPTYPAERIDYMLADSAAPILLTQSHLGLGHAGHVIAVDSAEAQLAAQPTHNPQTQTTPQHLAYVIYTSGSTGQPKGVANQHDGVFNRLLWAQQQFQLTSHDHVLQKTTFSFDVSVWEFFWTLVSGACLVVARPEGHKDPDYLCRLIQQKQITLLHFVPSMLRQFVSAAMVVNCTSLRTIITSGEALPLDLAQETHRTLPAAELHNLYGPTEAAVDVSHWAYRADSQVVPIGKPIANTTLYILDGAGAVVPIGVNGELYIGGVQLAREYLNRPELTAERFIDHPEFGRLYQTGDLCRWLPDGNIEYIGRTDFQVKIRGFRIELGEIESALLAQEGVQEAVVVAHEAEQGDKRLVAYLVGDAESNRLREQLALRLPTYMIPAAFVQLAAMPLNTNGKLDRRALPAPDYASAQTTFVAPRNEVETSLVEAFTAVLRAQQVGIHDNFFWLGGDSILSIQLVSRIAQQGYTVSVKDIFLYPTVAELATAVRTANEVRADQSLQLGNAPLLPVQRRFLAANQPQLHHFNQSYLLTVKQPIEPTQLEEAIRTLLRHHDALRFQYSQDGAEWQQQYLPPEAHVPLEVVDLHSVSPEQRRAEIEALCASRQTSLDPLAGDLTRWVYFNGGGAAADRLLIVIHHLAVDGVSWRILLEDLVTLLDGGQLPPKTSSYRDWGEMLQSATEQGHFATQINDWLDAVGERPFPLDNPTALNTIGNSHHLKLTLAHEQTAQLLRTLPDLHEVTLDAVLLTALTETLADWSGQAGLRVNFESYGRQELFDTINLNRTVGWFTSLYPLTIPRFDGSALRRIRYTLDTLRQVKDGGISFGALRDFHPDEAIRQQFEMLPDAAVVYNYLGQLNSLDNGRFTIAPESSGSNVAADFLRKNLIASNAAIIDEQLHINWSVSPQLHRESAEWLLNNFRQKLDWLIREALTSEEWIPIRSDFPEADLSLEKFELLMQTANGKQASESVETDDREVGTL